METKVEVPVYLFRLTKNGKTLAVAKLEVAEEDNEEAWQLFCDAWGNISNILTGSFFQTMRIATGQSPVPAGTPEVVGIGIDLKPFTNLVVPKAGTWPTP